MDVIDRIRAVETTNRAGHSDVPAEPIAIAKAEIDELDL
jgi:peptidyl-prolyl cis-trans isomerase B (cyclophilin B)